MKTLNLDDIKKHLIGAFVMGALTVIILAQLLIIVSTVKFVANHNFAVAKYSGTISYVANDGSGENDVYPYVIDTEGYNHTFFEQQGAITKFLFTRYLPKEDTYLNVFEVKLYNSKTERLRLLRLIW